MPKKCLKNRYSCTVTPEELSAAISACLSQAVAAGEIAVEVPETVRVERPKSREHGDWSTNIALQLGKKASMAPRDFAAMLVRRLSQVEGIGGVEIAGPGFLNITLDAAAAGELARTIVEAGDSFGHDQALAGHVVNMEFVSANPTGPLHIGHTRWAALGDAIGRVLRASGAQVTSEYYINDAGNQMNVFARSVYNRMHGLPVPEGGYPGEYIKELADIVLAQAPELAEQDEQTALPKLRDLAYTAQLADIKSTLADFGVHFDVFFSESALHDGGAVADAVARLREQGHIFDLEGAVWLRTTDFGDDKDRVLIRANGEPTYFAADAAYYLSKKDRGFSEKIYLLGADHHGYVNRLKAIAACAGDDKETNIEVLIGQLISVEWCEAVQARGQHHRAARSDQLDRRRRAALLAGALPGRFADRAGPGAAEEEHQRQPGLLRAVRPRALLRRFGQRAGQGRHPRILRRLAAHRSERKRAAGGARPVPFGGRRRRAVTRTAPHRPLPGTGRRCLPLLVCRHPRHPAGRGSGARSAPHPVVAQRRHHPGSGQRTDTAGRLRAREDVI